MAWARRCAENPRCCVNTTSGVAFFHTRSHWTPKLPLSFAQTVAWMQRSRFCVCPGGDVTYNQRYFLALFSGCVPVIFGFTPAVSLGGSYCGAARGRDGPRSRTVSWWKPKGPANAGINPFAAEIDHEELVVELPRQQIDGFVQRLRAVPDAVVERKQRAIEAVRPLLLFDTSGARPDAFSMMLRELLRTLPPRQPLAPRRRRHSEKQ